MQDEAESQPGENTERHPLHVADNPVRSSSAGAKIPGASSREHVRLPMVTDLRPVR